MKTKDIQIEEFIHDFRTKNGIHFFLYGGCYIFSRILQINFGGVIYSNTDHCRLRIRNYMYDITGKHDIDESYKIIDQSHEARYTTYESFIK